MKKVLIAGGTGLIGKHLSQILNEKGYAVFHLSRKQNLKAQFPAYKWDIKAGMIEEAALENVYAVINLAGAGIADKRWTDARKKLIIDSRVNGTLLLKKYIAEGKLNPKVYIGASAIGYYGNSGEELVDENGTTRPGEFLSDSTYLWEQSIQEIANTGLRTVTLRVGIVLSTQGGALEKMLIPFKVFQASYFGNGKMWTSWVHLEDVSQMFVYALENDQLKGIYNAVAPEPVRNIDLIKTLKKAINKPAILFSVPAMGLKLAMGEMANAVLGSTNVSSEKLVRAGFEYQFPELLPALKDLLARKI